MVQQKGKISILQGHEGAKNVPSGFWAECMRTIAYIINKHPQPKMGFISPFEKLWNLKPTESHFRVFGCVRYVFAPDHLHSKFDKKAIWCILLVMMRTEKASDAVILQQVGPMSHAMLCLMKHHHGGRNGTKGWKKAVRKRRAVGRNTRKLKGCKKTHGKLVYINESKRKTNKVKFHNHSWGGHPNKGSQILSMPMSHWWKRRKNQQPIERHQRKLNEDKPWKKKSKLWKITKLGTWFQS